MLHFEIEPMEIIPTNGMVFYKDLENILVINNENIHDIFGCIDERKVIELAISKYSCFPYRLNGVGKYNNELIFIKE